MLMSEETKRIVDSEKWSVAPGSLIAEGEALAAKATPGEWRCHAGCDDDGSWAMIGPEHDPNYDADTDEEPSEVAEAKAEADAAFVMWLVERWPALLATAREVEGLRATCDSMMDSAIASANQLTEARAQVESLLSRVEDVTGATDALTYEAACAALDGMVDARRELGDSEGKIRRAGGGGREAVKLTKAQREMLESAEHWTTPPEMVGVIPRGSGQFATIISLQRMGLVEFVDYGRDVEGEGGCDERPIYAITDAGRAALAGKEK